MIFQHLCARALWLRACAWAHESTSDLLLRGTLQRRAVCFASVFVSVVFCNSEVAEHPDTLFTCFYDNRTNQKYPRSQKAISVINSVITVYHKRDDYFYHLVEATTGTSQKGCNWAIMHFCMHNFLRLRDFRADIEVHCLTETNGDAKFRLIWY